MPNFIYDIALQGLWDGSIDLNSDDIRIILVDSSTTADTETAAATISEFTTLSELTNITGTGYERKLLANEAVSIDAPNNRAEFDFDDPQYTAIDAGTAAGAVVYKHITTDADSVPICFIEGKFTVTAAAPAIVGDTTVFVDPLDGAIASGNVLTFSGGGTATLSANASLDDRSISVNALAVAIGLGETALATDNLPGNFPIPTNGSNLILAVNVEGLMHHIRS